MEPGLSAADVDQLSQLLGECHLEEEQAALAQVMRPAVHHVAAPSTGTASAMSVEPWADEMMRRLQGCSSPDAGRAVCAELMVAFQAQQQQQFEQQLLLQRPQSGLQQIGSEPEAEARLQSLQGANRVIVRALRAMSDRQRTLGNRCRHAEETAGKLSSELQARDEQLHASERAKAMLQSHLQVLLRNEQGMDLAPQVQQLPGGPCS
mmetsp:Transcript_5430/g.10190  ORF Transcript_5430/g.10190 Transcript_5430/m.10190 type:complete len:207 (+) Transcript_5430:100-720(+)